MSGVFQTIDPPTPSPPSECVLPQRQQGGCCGVSANEYSCAHGAQINFGYLTLYLALWGNSLCLCESRVKPVSPQMILPCITQLSFPSLFMATGLRILPDRTVTLPRTKDPWPDRTVLLPDRKRFYQILKVSYHILDISVTKQDGFISIQDNSLLWIRAILVRIQIRILLFLSVSSRCQQKKVFSKFFFALLFEGTFTKVIKKSQNSRNQGFSYYFHWIIEGSGSRSVPLTKAVSETTNRWIESVNRQRESVATLVFFSNLEIDDNFRISNNLGLGLGLAANISSVLAFQPEGDREIEII